MNSCRPFPALLRAACLGIILLVLLFGAGCASNGEQPDPFLQKWREMAEQSEPRPPAKHQTSQPHDKDGNALPSEEERKDQGESAKKPASLVESMSDLKDSLPAQPITVRFIKEDVGNVLRALGRMANQNIIINPSVAGTVNAHIEETPWNEVLLGIVNTYGLILTREGKLLRIMTVDDLKKHVERKTLQLEQDQVSPLVTRKVGIEYADPEKMQASIKPLLTTDKANVVRGSVTVDAHSRSLVIRESEENLPKLVKLVAELDQPTPQILIGAHIVETSRDTAREIGIQWGGFVEAKTPGRLFITPGGINGTVNDTTGRRTYTSGALGTARGGIGEQGFAMDLPASAIAGIPPASLGLLSFSGSGILEMQLSALQQAGKLNILSSPSIATLDNTQAIIESGTDVPFQTVEDGQFKIIYKEATLKLTVTPHVISDKMVKLTIEAKKDEVDPLHNVNGNPYIIKKLAQTQLIVENGVTVVIAGLSKESQGDTGTGVPGAKDIPLLGWLFKKESNSANFQELLIFITPKILTAGGTNDIDQVSNLVP